MTKVAKSTAGRYSSQPRAIPAETLRGMAMLATSGAACGAAVIEVFQKNLLGKELKFEPVFEELRERVTSIQSGDLSMVESMLFSQAAGLQSMFASLTRRADAQDVMSHYQTFMGLALKAQTQSRATLEALVELKRPRQQPTFVKQANIANGPQQVNNGVDTTLPNGSAHIADAQAHAGKTAGQQNELLEQQHGNYLDAGAQSPAGRTDPHLEAVAAGHRATQP